MDLRFLNGRDCEIAYREAGSGEEAVLFIHGFPTSSFLWRSVLPRVGQRRRAIAPDLLGLGDTRGPLDADYSAAGQAKLCLDLLDGLGIDTFTAVGHGQGGAVAQLLAVEHPERTERLVLIDAAAFDNWPTTVDHTILFLIDLPVLPELARRAGLLGALASARFRFFPEVLERSALPEEARREYERPFLESAEALRRLQRYAEAMDCMHTVHAATALARYERPTAILWAGDDRLYSVSWAKRLYDTIPGAERFEIIPGCGHLVPEEKPIDLADALADFLDDSSGTSGADTEGEDEDGEPEEA